jgi:hypothetical protein
LVRIQRRVSKKLYLKAKRTYEYERIFLDIPSKFHGVLKPFLKQDFDVKVAVQENRVIVTLTPRENVSACRKPPDKTQSKTTETTVQERQTSDFV